MIYILYLIISIYIIICINIIYKYNNKILLKNTIFENQFYEPLLNNDIYFQDL